MYRSYGLTGFLKPFLIFNSLLAALLANDHFRWFADLPAMSKITLPVLVVSAIAYLVCETSLFPKLTKLPLVWRMFPNIDGEYEVEISSNWSIIQAMMEGEKPDITPEGNVTHLKRTGKAKITTRLTRIDMSLIMDDGYLSSEVITCTLRSGKSVV